MSAEWRKNRCLLLGAAIFFMAGCGGGGGSAENGHEGHDQAQESKTQTSIYQCPMHPTYTSDKAGKCGICGMDLVPGKKEDRKEVAGQAEVSIGPTGRQLIGLRSAPVARRKLKRIIRVSGRIAYDPGLFSAQEEFLAARKSLARLRGAAGPEAVRRAESLVSSSRLKLKLLGLSDSQINALAKRGEPDANLLMAQTGKGSVWLYADIYEHEFGLVEPGQGLEAATLAYPGRRFAGEVAAIDPVVNPKTRTVRLRALIDNKEGSLKPGMFMNVSIGVDLGETLAVPEVSVLFTGTRRLVFLEREEGRFEPREVELGMKGQEYYQVLSGLEEGDRVVVSGNFLVDSESKLKAAISRLTGHSGH